jgi:hypothetical protein
VAQRVGPAFVEQTGKGLPGLGLDERVLVP